MHDFRSNFWIINVFYLFFSINGWRSRSTRWANDIIYSVNYVQLYKNYSIAGFSYPAPKHCYTIWLSNILTGAYGFNDCPFGIFKLFLSYIIEFKCCSNLWFVFIYYNIIFWYLQIFRKWYLKVLVISIVLSWIGNQFDFRKEIYSNKTISKNV